MKFFDINVFRIISISKTLTILENNVGLKNLLYEKYKIAAPDKKIISFKIKNNPKKYVNELKLFKFLNRNSVYINEIIKNLSATGSNSCPNRDSWWYFLAIKPSRKSVKIAIINKNVAAFQYKDTEQNIIIGVNKIRKKVIWIGTDIFII